MNDLLPGPDLILAGLDDLASNRQPIQSCLFRLEHQSCESSDLAFPKSQLKILDTNCRTCYLTKTPVPRTLDVTLSYPFGQF